jgi:O-antigen/teichoic acid export membrane protein
VSSADPVSARTPAPPGNARARRVAWGLMDQVLSSASNFVVTIIAARSLSASAFGAFALAMVVAMMTVFLARGLASDPLATAHASDDADELAAAARAGAFTALVVCVTVGVLTAATGLVIGGTAGRVLLVMALFLPGITLQDYLRYVLIIQGRARTTFLNDLFWLVAELPAMIWVVSAGGGAALLLAAWGLTGTLACALGFVQAGTGIGHPGLVRPWLRRHRDLWPFFVLDNIVYQSTNLVVVVVISLTTSLAQVGGFRAAMTVFAPLAILGRGVVGVAVPELARRRHDPRGVERLSLLIGWVLAPTAVVWAALSLLIPDATGRAFLGDSWDLARPLLLLAGFSIAAGQFAVGTAVGIRALGAGRHGLTARMVVSVIALVAAAVGGYVDGAHGVMLTLALTAPVQVVIWWWLLVRAARRDFLPTSSVVPREH